MFDRRPLLELFTTPSPPGSPDPQMLLLFTDDLRDKERAKIECRKAHFKTLAVRERPARYTVARTVDGVLSST